MHTIEAGGHVFTVCRAQRADVAGLVALLADDVLAGSRESGDLAPYLAAFDDIDSDPNHYLAVIRDAAGDVCGSLQLSLVPGLSRGGTKRLQIEAVRLAPSTRGKGLGTALFAWAHDWGRRHGASLAQLTTDKRRTDAHRFYEVLGYTAGHEGFERPLGEHDDEVLGSVRP